MTKIKVSSHPEICPDGVEIEVTPGESLCETLLDNGISIEHACELSCACTTCHVVVKKGFSGLEEASEAEEDMLDMAFEPDKSSRLTCQITVIDDLDGLVVKMPSKQG